LVGFRKGELLGLEWSSVSYDDHSISIVQSIPLTTNGEAVVKAPKTKSSIRIVDMPEWYMRELKEYHHQSKLNRLQAGDAWQGGDKYYVRLHDLRHSAASLLIENGVDLKTIQERLGHKKYQTTADIYAHISKKIKVESASKLDKFEPSNIIRLQPVFKSSL
jgi:integrase